MTTAKGDATRSRLTTAAMELFGQRGFRATTVGDIEAAAGLSARSGAFYRHFSDKEAVLRAGLEAHALTLAGIGDELDDLLPLGNQTAELTLLARWALRFLHGQQPLLRIMQRDADQFPDLVAEVRAVLIMPGYGVAEAQLIRLLQERGASTERVRELAALVLGAIVHWCEDVAIYGAPPADANEEAFVATWVEMLSAVIDQRAATNLGASSDAARP